jgi:hypothetical protein
MILSTQIHSQGHSPIHKELSMKLIRILLLAILASCLPQAAHAQTSFWVENQTAFLHGDVAPQIDIYVTKKVTKETSVFLWSLVSKSWGENIIGLNLDPADWIEIGAGVGIEANPSPLRGFVQLWAGKSRASLYLCGEDGGSGTWYMVDALIRLTKSKDANVSIGVFGKRFAGFGPEFQTDVTKHFQLKLVPKTWDPEKTASGSFIVNLRWLP